MHSPPEDDITTLLERVRHALAPGLDVERQLGAGAMGVVFLGRDVALDRPVAIKVLRPEAATAVAAERFLREARLLARLQHPHVIQVHQAGESAGLFYFVMDLVDGETVASRLARGPLGLPESLRLAEDLLDALGTAHALGIVHRDIKPSNIFLTAQGARLGDFGIARGADLAEEETLSRDLGVLGTPAYMAPEQAGGGPVTATADLYAVGLILYQCLTGQRWPRFADPAHADWKGVPARIRRPLTRALALNPGERWPTAEAFRGALRRRPQARAAIMAVLVLTAVVGGVMAWRDRVPDPGQDVWGPGQAAPHTARGQRGFESAERSYRRGAWDSAAAGFSSALAQDSTCLICAFRLVDVDRWLEHPPDQERLAYLLAVRDRFPQPYRELIEAQALTGRARLEALSAAARRYRSFPLTQYLLGNEVFNRGPLFRVPRDEAIAALQLAVQLDSSFAAPWFDLTLARIASGDQAGADLDLRHLHALGPAVGLAYAQYTVAGVAFAFRFGGDGLKVFRSAVNDPALRALPHLSAGPRVLTGLGTPAGAVLLGQEYEQALPDAALRRSGLVAQIVGWAALGQLDSMRSASTRLGREVIDAQWTVFGPAVEATLLLADDAASSRELERAAGALDRFVRPGSDPMVRREAAWLLALIHRQQGDTSGARAAMALLANEPPPGAASLLLLAWDRSAEGEPDQALGLTDSITVDLGYWDEANRDPTLRGALHLFRARWIAQAGNAPDAVREYLWHQHFHLPRYPTAEPTAADGDWALSTLAEWLQARLLDQGRPGTEVCRSYGIVADRWRLGAGRYRARADTALDRASSLGCPGF